MLFSIGVFFRVAILVLSSCGFFVAKHIRSHKTKNTPLICSARFDCHTVVHSDYSKFLGIPVEFAGMFYYIIIFLLNLSFLFTLVLNKFESVSSYLSIFLLVLSLVGFIFSAYLIGVQTFIIKKGCSWCIVSALICLTILILGIQLYGFHSFLAIFGL